MFRFHEWRGNATGCLPRYNASTILAMVLGRSVNEGNMPQKKNWKYQNNLISDARDNAIGSAFIIQWVAGIFVFITVLLASLSVCVYCWHIRKKWVD